MAASSIQPGATIAMARRTPLCATGATNAGKEHEDMMANGRRVEAEQIRGAALRREERAENMVAAEIVAAATETRPREATAAPAAGAAVKNFKQWSRSRRCSSAAKAAIARVIGMRPRCNGGTEVLFSK